MPFASVPRSFLRPRPLVLLAAAALQWPVAAFGASSLTASAGGGYGPNPASQTTTGGSASQANTGSGSRGSNTSNATASFGLLRLYAEAHSTAGSSPTLIAANAGAAWRDDFLISSSTLNGQTGRVTFSLRIDGNLTGFGNELPTQTSNRSRTTADYDFYQNGGKIGTGSETHYVNNGEITGTPFLNQAQTFTVDFVYGTPFELRLDVRAGALSYSTGSTAVDTYADLGHTATWGGFSAVTDAQGNPAAYTFSSTSGTNYQQAIVPEPGVNAMLLSAGVGTLCVVLRRRGGGRAARVI